MQKTILASVAALALGMSEDSYRQEFANFVSKYEKTYTTEELFYRYDVFRANMDRIAKHNADTTQKYTMGANQFMDLTADEFGQIYMSGMLKKGNRTVRAGQAQCSNQPAGTTSEQTVDWEAKGMVTAIKNQGQCGSCWSFSSTGALESSWGIKNGKTPIPLSEQQLMDCSWGYGNMGCNGGLMDYSFEYWIDNNGACTEADYPYTAQSSHTCRKCTPVAQVASCADVATQDVDALKAQIATAPVSVAIEADQSAFQFYKSGVLTGECGTNLDHGVLAVGFDDTYQIPYWKVKNSWGESWGMNGYVLIEQAGDECGIQLDPSFPVAA